MPTSSAPDGLAPGDAVLIRSVFRGRVRWCVPHRLAGADDDRLVLYSRIGAQGKATWRDPQGRYTKRWIADVPPCDCVWSRGAEAIALGVFDEDEAAAIRAEGERVLAAPPWPTGWEDWRPPAEREPLPLPHGWDDVS